MDFKLRLHSKTNNNFKKCKKKYIYIKYNKYIIKHVNNYKISFPPPQTPCSMSHATRSGVKKYLLFY